jgi:hypothetical protein
LAIIKWCETPENIWYRGISRDGDHEVDLELAALQCGMVGGDAGNWEMQGRYMRSCRVSCGRKTRKVPGFSTTAEARESA